MLASTRRHSCQKFCREIFRNRATLPRQAGNAHRIQQLELAVRKAAKMATEAKLRRLAGDAGEMACGNGATPEP